MDALKITVLEDVNKYTADNKKKGAVLGELRFSDSYPLDSNQIEGLARTILALYPHDAVRLDIRYSIGNS